MTAALIDTHAHLAYPPLIDTLDLVLARARACGVETIITIGTDPENSRATLDLAEKQEMLFAIPGIHPHEADKFQTVDDLKPLLGHPKVLALGETGLDYHYQFANRPNQRRLFEAHLDLAARTGLPAIVHCREAFDDLLAILNAAPPRPPRRRPLLFRPRTRGPANPRPRLVHLLLRHRHLQKRRRASPYRPICRPRPYPHRNRLPLPLPGTGPKK